MSTALLLDGVQIHILHFFSWAPGSQVVASWVPHSKSPSEAVKALLVHMSQVCFSYVSQYRLQGLFASLRLQNLQDLFSDEAMNMEN